MDTHESVRLCRRLLGVINTIIEFNDYRSPTEELAQRRTDQLWPLLKRIAALDFTNREKLRHALEDVCQRETVNMLDLAAGGSRAEFVAYLLPDRNARGLFLIHGQEGLSMKRRLQTFEESLKLAEQAQAAAPMEVGPTPPKKPRKPGSGRKVDTDPLKDREVFEAWKTDRFRSLEELAAEFNSTKQGMERAIDRHRKRQKRTDRDLSSE